MFGWASLLAGRWWVGQVFYKAVIWCGGCMRGLVGELAGGRVGWRLCSWTYGVGGVVVGTCPFAYLQCTRY